MSQCGHKTWILRRRCKAIATWREYWFGLPLCNKHAQDALADGYEVISVDAEVQ